MDSVFQLFPAIRPESIDKVVKYREEKCPVNLRESRSFSGSVFLGCVLTSVSWMPPSPTLHLDETGRLEQVGVRETPFAQLG